MDPSLVTVVGVASTDKKAVKSPETATKDKQKKKHSTLVKKSTTDAKLEALEIRNGPNDSVVLKRSCYQSL